MAELESKKTTKKVAATSAPKMISVEEANAQVQALMKQANQKMQQLAAQCSQLENLVRDKVIDQLFKVIEYSHMFEPDFVTKCTEVISQYITNMAINASKEEEGAETKNEPEEK